MVILTRGRATLVRDDEHRIGAGPTRSGLRDRAHVDPLDNWSVPEIDLNADLGEGDSLTPSDAAVLDAVSSVSIACGFHAGGLSVMRETVHACVERGVTVGAHVSYRDREGFGRRVVEVEPALLVEDLIEQCVDLAEIAASLGAEVAYVKPHGALYHQMGSDSLVAAAVCEATSRQAVGVLVTQGRGHVVDLARRAGLRVVHEGFPDRARTVRTARWSTGAWRARSSPTRTKSAGVRFPWRGAGAWSRSPESGHPSQPRRCASMVTRRPPRRPLERFAPR